MVVFRARSRSGGKGVLYRHFDNKKAPALLQGPTSIIVFVIRVFVRNVRNLDLLEFGIAFFGILSEVFPLPGPRCFALCGSFIEFLIVRNQIIGRTNNSRYDLVFDVTREIIPNTRHFNRVL